jgi:hypothetical protein
MGSRGSYSRGINFDNGPLIAVGAGKIPNVKHVNFQTLGPVNNGLPEVLNPLGITSYVYPSDAGEAVTIRSTDVGDTTIVCTVQGLDENLEFATEVVTLNGTTPVPVPGLWARVNRVTNTGVDMSIGNVLVEGGGNVYNGFVQEHQISYVGVFSLPADMNAQVLEVLSSMIRDGGGTTATAVNIYTRFIGTNVFFLGFPFGLQREGSASLRFVNAIPGQLNTPIDLEIRAGTGDNGVEALVRTAILLEDK